MADTNWDQELKRIEREFQGLNPDPVIKLDNARKASERHAHEQRRARGSAVWVWVRLALVTSLAASLYFWPYPHACGVGLYGYMGAMVVILAGSLWVAASSWEARLVRPHAGAMLMVIVGLALLATQILPRVGYASVDPAKPPTWSCVAA